MNPTGQLGSTKTEDNVTQTAITTTGETNTSALAAAAQAEVLARYTMADRRPRQWLGVESKLLKECDRPAFAEAARYLKPVGGGIEGPSIRFAEACLRLAGNMAAETRPSFENDEMRTLLVVVTDYETNAIVSHTVTIPKTVERSRADGREVLGQRINSSNKVTFKVRATEDELLNTTNALVSKARRNLILQLVPGDIIANGQARCVHTQQQADKADPMAATKKLVAAFYDISVSAEQIAAFLGHPIETMTNDERMELRSIGLAIKDGETTWAASFDAKKGGGTTAAAPPATTAAPMTPEGLEANLAAKLDAADTTIKVSNVVNRIVQAARKRDISPEAGERLKVRAEARKVALSGKPGAVAPPPTAAPPAAPVAPTPASPTAPTSAPASAPAVASAPAPVAAPPVADDDEARQQARDQADYEEWLKTQDREPGQEG